MDGASALAELGSRRGGLTPGEAADRLARFGGNRIDEGRESGWPALLARQFLSPLCLILVFGAAISVGLGDWLDAAIIVAILAGSGLLSFSQEYRAARAVAALRAQLALRATVRRDGAVVAIPADRLVPGDIVLLSAGNLVPADGLVLEARDCQVTEASLTGESLPVEKTPAVIPAETPVASRSNMLFTGTSLRSGTATLLVARTGRQTEYGGIAERLRKAEPETEFARGVRRFGAVLLRVMIVIVLAVLATNQLLGRPAAESLLFAVALAVGLSPELLPAIISVTLAAGARNLAAGGVIVRRLDAIENLGGIDVLCTDKTGTLTEGAVRLDAAIDPAGASSDAVERAAFLNASFETGIANPLDLAITAAGAQHNLSAAGVRKLDEIPYDFLRRRLSVVVAEGSAATPRMITKGAFAEVLAVCSAVRTGGADAPLDGPAREAVEALVREKSAAGYRALAVAERTLPPKARYDRSDEAGMTLLGLLLFLDPPKTDAPQTIRALHELGIAVKMITGDNRYVAMHVAHAVGLDAAGVLTGEQVANMSAEALRRKAADHVVFAEIDPQQKERVLRALQQAGHAVGYMGDGINDAPALHLADVGISVDGAVDVARESADVVLLEKDLGVLQRGVVAGRRTFRNTLKYIAITTSANFGNMVSMALATPLLPFLPLLPKQILLNNFLSDIPSIAISTDRVDPEHLAAPQRWDVRQVRRFMIGFGLISSLFDVMTFAALLLVFRAGADEFRTAWFVVSLLTELAVLFVLRTDRFALTSRPSALMAWSAGVVALVALALPYLPVARDAFGLVPLNAVLLSGTIAITLCYAAATEAAKRWLVRAPTRPVKHGGAAGSGPKRPGL